MADPKADRDLAAMSAGGYGEHAPGSVERSRSRQAGFESQLRRAKFGSLFDRSDAASGFLAELNALPWSEHELRVIS